MDADAHAMEDNKKRFAAGQQDGLLRRPANAEQEDEEPEQMGEPTHRKCQAGKGHPQKRTAKMKEGKTQGTETQ